MSLTDREPGTGFGFEIAGKLHAAITTLASKLEEHTNQLARQYRRVLEAGAILPINTVSADVEIAASGAAVLDLGGPAQGRVWDVRRLVAGGKQVTIAAAGSADAFFTAAPASSVPGGLTLAEWVDTAATLPLTAYWGAGEFELRYPEHLFVVFRSATNGQQYMAAARFVDRLESPTTRSELTV